MAPDIVLTYFEARARAEPVRMAFAYGGIKFNDIRIKMEEWPALKATGGNYCNQQQYMVVFTAHE